MFTVALKFIALSFALDLARSIVSGPIIAQIVKLHQSNQHPQADFYERRLRADLLDWEMQKKSSTMQKQKKSLSGEKYLTVSPARKIKLSSRSLRSRETSTPSERSSHNKCLLVFSSRSPRKWHLASRNCIPLVKFMFCFCFSPRR